MTRNPIELDISKARSLFALYPQGLTEDRLAVQLGYRPKSDRFKNIVQAMNAASEIVAVKQPHARSSEPRHLHPTIALFAKLRQIREEEIRLLNQEIQGLETKRNEAGKAIDRLNTLIASSSPIVAFSEVCS